LPSSCVSCGKPANLPRLEQFLLMKQGLGLLEELLIPMWLLEKLREVLMSEPVSLAFGYLVK